MIDEILKDGPVNGFPDIELEKLIDKYNLSKDEALFNDIANKIDKSKLLIPLATHEKEITGMYLIQNPDNKEFYMIAFTSVKEYKKWEQEENRKSETFMIETFANIVSILLKEDSHSATGLVIDPYGLCITIPKQALKNEN